VSWPPAGVDLSLAEKLSRVFADVDKAQSRVVEIGAAITRLMDERSRTVPAAELLPRAEEVLAAAKATKNPTYAATAELLRADILLQMNRPQEALSKLNAARLDWFGVVAANDSGSLDAPERATDVQFLTRIAQARMALKDIEGASKTCEEAIAEIERDRYKVSAPYLQSAFLKNRALVYNLGVGTAFLLRDYETMLTRAELTKARSVLRLHRDADASPVDPQLASRFLELSNQARVRNPRGVSGLPETPQEAERRRAWDLIAISEFSDPHGRARPLPPFSLRALQDIIELDEAVVYYYWLEPGVLLVTGIDRQRVMVDVETLSDEKRNSIDEVIGAIQTHPGSMDEGTLPEFDKTLLQCSSILLPEKMRGLMAGKTRLVLSPHRRLHLFPFHALEWNGGLLIEQFAVSYAPNLTVLLAPAAAVARSSVLVAGVGKFKQNRLALPPLPAVRSEVEGIADVYRRQGIGIEILADEEVTRQELLGRSNSGSLQAFSCIHLATHGASVLGKDASDTPMESCIFVSDAALDGLEISTLRLRADLVVLSACNSGQRAVSGRGMDELPGDDVFGLQAAFAMAGAQAVLGCLWTADDAAAKAIMISFHRYCAQLKPIEVALQMALLDYLRNAGPLHRHSWFWAPFFLSILGARSHTPERMEPDHA
jgi:CHAT domain-containing protein